MGERYVFNRLVLQVVELCCMGLECQLIIESVCLFQVKRETQALQDCQETLDKMELEDHQDLKELKV